MLRLLNESHQEAVSLESPSSPIRTEPGNVGTEEDGIIPMLRFSPRGKEVFAFMLEGLGNTEISERLGMSISGVKRHREKMLLQNDCKSILQLIAKYYRAAGCKDQTNE
jgi:DNA-binding CsgD family transcriptional regulator